MPTKWKTVKIGSFLKERPDRFKPAEANSLALKRIGKIDFQGNIHISDITNTKTNMILVKSGDLVISGINAEKGAVSIYQGVEDVLATIHYSSYEFDALQIDIKYFKWFLKSSTFKNILLWQAGGGIKTELKPKKLLLLEIQLPDIDTQHSIVDIINNISTEINEITYLNYDNQDLVFHLRQTILQEALCGKLVEQNPDDEPANILLEKIREEKERLIKEKIIKKEKPLPPITEDEIPFELPRGWEWVRLGNIINNFGQKKPDKQFSYIDVSSINNKKGTICEDIEIISPKDAPSRARKIVQQGAVIYSTVRPYLLNIAIVDRDFESEPIASTAFAVLNPYSQVSNKYLFYCLRSKFFIDYVESKMVGMAYPAINDSKLYNALVPLPPINEQIRIVKKINQLMILCDELEGNIEQSKQQSEMLMEAVLREAFN